MNDPVLTDLDRMFEREEYLKYLEDQALEEKQIVDLETCASKLCEQLMGLERLDKDVLARCCMFLIKKCNLKDYSEYVDEDEIEVVGTDKYFGLMQKQIKDMEDQKKRTAEHVKSLVEQICGQGELDEFKVSQNLKNLLWSNGEKVTLDDKINIQRKV